MRSAVGSALVLVGCGSTTAPSESAALVCSSIVGGTADPEHSGVMALLGSDGALVCSGTLIRAQPKPAVLTAAHCFSDQIALVAVGNDYQAADRLTYDAGEFLTHPQFDERTGEFDFAVLMLEGAVDPAWVVPVLSPEEDELSAGTAVQFVGYGSTDAPSVNSRRNEVGGAITSVGATSFDYLQTAGGPCSGDSGGPALIDVGGRQVVAGVTSYGDGHGCWSRGVSARASAAAEFLNALGPNHGPCLPTQQGTTP